jgi:hypothetical protein
MVRSLTYSRADYRRHWITIQAALFKLHFNCPPASDWASGSGAAGPFSSFTASSSSSLIYLKFGFVRLIQDRMIVRAATYIASPPST